MWIGFVCLIVFYLISALWAFFEIRTQVRSDSDFFIEYYNDLDVLLAVFFPVFNFIIAYVLAEQRQDEKLMSKKWIKKIFKI